MAKNHARKTANRRAIQSQNDGDVIQLETRRGKTRGSKSHKDPSTRPAKKEDVRFLRTGLKCKTQKQKIMAQLIDEMDVIVATGEAGTGKAQPLTSRLKTPDGWILMGDVEVGQLLQMPDGTSAPVSAIYPQGSIDVYRIRFEDGRTVECCADHLWKVYQYNWTRHGDQTGYRVIDTKEIIKLLQGPHGERRTYVPLLTPPEGEDIALPLDPYLLGVLLGDGYLGPGCVRFSSADTQIVEAVRQALPDECEIVKYPGSKLYDYAIVGKVPRVNPVLDIIRALGLEDVRSYAKFVPSIYFRGSLSQRMDLIRGLMDTDGTIDVNGTTSFSTTSSVLSSHVQHLIRSIGGLAKVSRKQPNFTHRGILKLGRLAFSVNIRTRDPGDLFHLDRKRHRAPTEYQYRDALRLRIASVEHIGQKEAQCITVDHPDHLYITDGYTVTHNTHVAVWKACEALDAKQIERIVLTRPAVEADEENLGFLPGEADEKVAPYFAPYMQILEKYFGKGEVECLIKNGVIVAQPLAFIRGHTFENAMVILDEAQNTTPKQMKTILTRIGEFGKIVVDGDLTQCDLPRARLKGGVNGLVDAIRRFRNTAGFGFVHFVKADIVRSGLCQRIVEGYADDTLAVAQQIGATAVDDVYGGMLDAAAAPV